MHSEPDELQSQNRNHNQSSAVATSELENSRRRVLLSADDDKSALRLQDYIVKHLNFDSLRAS